MIAAYAIKVIDKILIYTQSCQNLRGSLKSLGPLCDTHLQRDQAEAYS